MTSASIHTRQNLTTAQWRAVFTRMDCPTGAATTDPRVAEVLAFFDVVKQRESPETHSFVRLADALAARDAPQAGVRCGNYTLIEPIGRGGMGSVWRAQRSDGLYAAEVAVKLLGSLALSSQARARFAREGVLLARLTHPHIARLLDAGITADQQRFLVIELVNGVDIRRFCESRPVRERIVLFRQLLAAVGYAHTQLVLHRDIKPGNVLVDQTGNVKLLDFGVAKLVSDADTNIDGESEGHGDDELTRHMGAAFTEQYASPEQVRGDSIGTQSDVFSLGTLLIELVTGERAAWTHPKQLWQVAQDAVRLTNRQDGIDADLRAIFQKATAADVADRYRSVDEFDRDVASFLAGEPVRARVSTRSDRAWRFVARHRLAVTSVSVAVSAVTASLVFALYQLVDAREQQAAARQEALRANTTTEFVTGLFTSLDPGIISGQHKSTQAARQMLDAGLARIRQSLDDQPETKIKLLGTLAELYGKLEIDDRFDEVNKERINYARAKFGDDHPAIYEAKIVDLWADIYVGNLISARATLTALDATLERMSATHPTEELKAARAERAAQHLYAWATIARNEGIESSAQILRRYEQAIGAFKRASPDSEDAATLRANYAIVLRESGRARDALIELDAALAHVERLNTPSVSELAGIEHERARTLALLGGTSAAQATFDRAIDLYARSGGANHVLTLGTRLTRAKWWHDLGLREKAWVEMEALARANRAPTNNAFALHEMHYVMAQMLANESRTGDAVWAVNLAIDGWRTAQNNPKRLKQAETLLAQLQAQSPSR